MHELSITEELLKTIVAKAEEAKARNVSRINLVIGEYAGVVEDSVKMCFEILSQDTIANGAVLEFSRIPAKFRCRLCGHTFPSGQNLLVCPECQGWNAEVIAGNEFFIESIEVDDESQSS
ncbi:MULTISPECIES: hydrogenase maturation nickel metallochaperone HypA [Dehalococcoides]|jgi:hydrogenase nickel incorporation protein HypA/HybF|uniref:Hydrogenase maturation factor HypA n=2 Tax=Dehalococcoides mccartyi TaxID=61435 RepID=HYPA_DEHMC|nr:MULTISPECIES: hydrogenase maturation nickel metallochaperone HypA [Dehalococcoides]Q3ZYW6.1 RecName: Full=Hydrogenase maturation factor HypA [Dehalococcoides mccartyi CBDB1]AGG06887.1 [NiFe] hydrogenase maturation protein HypA [Dehalococcoides mccartyi DCMB5]AII61385.1 hydrogenase nickel incorporation protein HypA [Dehalococcoides mccartyi CG5]AQU06412.1 hydrogenase nickel incorporation protein HypA [Dehalococcoides mccartyi]AQU07854.1 hydrogenase nickel incorporation protein HypA [Dehaloco